MLASEVVDGGLRFADPACQAQFGPAGTIQPDALDAFAHYEEGCCSSRLACPATMRGSRAR